MTLIQFKCRLLSDVIINAKASTEGPNQTLDFIPGSNFLGIAASKLYENGSADSLRLFHSGSIRFGDAHPAVSNTVRHRSLRVPAMLFYPKLQKMSEKCYVSMYTDFASELVRKDQPKQCRSGFLDMVDAGQVMEADVATNFAIKSAYDREHRRSKDAQMYGYESLRKGLTLFFEVEVHGLPADADAICDALTGIHRVGRSRTAQYGLVQIEPCEYSEVSSRPSTGQVLVYADGRLIFLDSDGMATFQPSAADLGVSIPGASINWEQTQLRTFQYAPWNYTRQCFDTDRCGIEKGSVFVVDLPEGARFEGQSSYIGCYRNEGFGKVIYNPHILDANSDGTSRLVFVAAAIADNHPAAGTAQTPLLAYLREQKKNEDNQFAIYHAVNTFVDKNAQLYRGDSFASQWGAIRDIATMQFTKAGIMRELFDKVVEEKKLDRFGKLTSEKTNMAYLVHGIAQKKWKKERLNALKEFITSQPEDIVREVVINLAAEMAKKCRR